MQKHYTKKHFETILYCRIHDCSQRIRNFVSDSFVIMHYSLELLVCMRLQFFFKGKGDFVHLDTVQY